MSLANMKQRNLSIELMNKLLKEEIKVYAKTNIVKSEEFSKRMKRIMEEYRQIQITNAESLDEFIQQDEDNRIEGVIDELIEVARDIVEADKMGEGIGLTKEETSFYHAIILPESIQNLYEDEVLIEMAKELTDELKDWQHKQSGRARMRSIVRRLLRKYDYPPEDMKEALQVVLRQCEHWTERRM